MSPEETEFQRDYWSTFWSSTAERGVDEKALARKMGKQGGLMLRKLDLAGKNIVDVGCGFGFIDHYLLQHARCRITGVDFGAHQAGLRSVPERLSYVSGDMLRLPIAPRTVDVAFCVEVLHHLDPADVLAAVDQLCSIVRIGGDVVMFEPNRLHPLIIALSIFDRSERHQMTLSISRIRQRVEARFQSVELVPVNYFLPTYKYRPPPLVDYLRPLVNRLEDLTEHRGICMSYAIIARGLKN